MSEPARKNAQDGNRDVVTSFRRQYAESLAEAQVSVALTGEEGWIKLYKGRQEQEQIERREMAVTLKSIAKTMEDSGLTEDEEKTLGELKKSSVAIRDRRLAFERDTVEPVRRPVSDCDKIIAEAINSARREEAEAPMLNIGLLETMNIEVGRVLRPRWSIETGQVTISVPVNSGE